MTAIGKRPGEVSQTLNVTGATLRNYVKAFGAFLSPEATAKTRKRYSDEDVSTLIYAKSFLDDGLTYDQVITRLDERPMTGEVLQGEGWEAHPVEPEPEEPTPEEEPDRQLVAQEIIKMLVDAKDETIDQLKDDKKQLQKEIAYLRLPWYQKPFTRQPGQDEE
jgi:DNA-binding transcriptional MerR regulator